MDVEFGPLETGAQHERIIELYGRSFIDKDTGQIGRLMLVQTVKPPQVRVEALFDRSTGRHSGRRLLAHGTEIEMLEGIIDDEGAKALIHQAVAAADGVDVRIDDQTIRFFT